MPRLKSSTPTFPVSAYIPGCRPKIENLLNGNFRTVMGDINAHHDCWFFALDNDARGNQIAEQIDDSDFIAINEDHPTRIVANRNSSPDSTIVSPSLLTCASWQPDVALNSDHIPITVRINKNVDFIKADERTHTNFEKADWQRLTSLK